MKTRLLKFIKWNIQKILIIIGFIIIIVLIHKIFISSYSCYDKENRSISTNMTENICFTIWYVWQSIFAGSVLISLVLLFKAFKK